MPAETNEEFVDRLNSYPWRVARDVAEALRAFDAQNLAAEGFDENLYSIAAEEFGRFFLSVPVNFSSFQTMRSRPVQWHTLYENVSQIIYPESSKVTSTNRANFAGQSIFYGSNGIDTTLLECGIQSETSVITGQYRLKDGCQISLIILGQIDHFRRHQRLTVQAPGIENILTDIFNGLSFDARQALYFCDAFLADYFSRTENAECRNVYEITARVANTLYANANIDGLLYPSVRHMGGLNVALKPEVFDTKFEMMNFGAINIMQDFGYGLYDYYEHAHGTQLQENGDFIWQMVPVHRGRPLNGRATYPAPY